MKAAGLLRDAHELVAGRRTLDGKFLHAVRISARDAVRSLMGGHDNENVPLELKSKPQGSEKESGAEQ